MEDFVNSLGVAGDVFFDDILLTNQVADPVDAIGSLVELILELNLHQGISNSLDAKLNAALNALDDMNENNDGAAVNSLIAFINAVEAQRGNEIEEADACGLIQAADEIIVALGGISSGSTCL